MGARGRSYLRLWDGSLVGGSSFVTDLWSRIGLRSGNYIVEQRSYYGQLTCRVYW